MLALTAAAAVALATIHVAVGWLRFLDVIPRSRHLSAAGGAAVAYVFVHLLPELAARQAALSAVSGAEVLAGEVRVYLTALAGVVAFYGLERLAKSSRRASPLNEPTVGVFRLHIGSFALYNVLIEYLLLHREEEGTWSLLVYSIAIALHFVSNDYGLRQHHRERYDLTARWILATAVLLGWTAGAAFDLSSTFVGLLFAFLAGGIVVNVLKEELPEERESRFLPFFLGACGYAWLLAID